MTIQALSEALLSMPFCGLPGMNRVLCSLVILFSTLDSLVAYFQSDPTIYSAFFVAFASCFELFLTGPRLVPPPYLDTLFHEVFELRYYLRLDSPKCNRAVRTSDWDNSSRVRDDQNRVDHCAT